MKPKGKHPRLELQLRDLELLRGLFESRVMKLDHVAALYFDGARESAKKRIQRLKAAGLVGERPRQPYEPSVLRLTERSFRLLKEQGYVHRYGGQVTFKSRSVADLTLRHELEVMDVKTAFAKAARAHESLRIQEFNTWPQLIEFETTCDGRSLSVKPDGFVSVYETLPDATYEHCFFLEVDRSSEVQQILIDRAVAYATFYRTGGFATRRGGRAEAFQEHPFRVLFVCRTAARRNNLADRLLNLNPPIRSLVWLTTLAEVSANPFGAIWLTPRHYLDIYFSGEGNRLPDSIATPVDTGEQSAELLKLFT